MVRTLAIAQIVVLSLLPAIAQAQPLPVARAGFGERLMRPVTSPYLNLLKRNTGFQYFQRVLPEQQLRQSYGEQFQSLRNLNGRVEQLGQFPGQQPGAGLGSASAAPAATGGGRGAVSGLGTTGHSTRFLSIGNGGRGIGNNLLQRRGRR